MTDRQSRIVALIVGRSSSRCSDCGGSAIPSHGDDHAHVMTSGWDQKPGCGATWTHITTDCAGDGIEASARTLAPHLPWIDYGDVVRQRQREPLTGAAGELLADHRRLRATLAAGGMARGSSPEPERAREDSARAGMVDRGAAALDRWVIENPGHDGSWVTNRVYEWPDDEADAYRSHGGFGEGNAAVQGIRRRKVADAVLSLLESEDRIAEPGEVESLLGEVERDLAESARLAAERDAARAEVERLRAQIAEAQEDLERFREWSNDLAGFVPEDQEVADPEGTQEGIISAWVEHLVADRDRLRAELHALKADPIARRADDGTVTVDWPDGARSCLIARELLDEMVSDGNRMHGDFSAARTAFLRTNSALRQVTEAADALLNRLLKAAPQDEHSATLAAGLARTLDQHRDKIDPTPYTPEYLPPHPEVERLRGLLAEAIDAAEDIGTWGADGTEQAKIARIKKEGGLT